MGFEKFDRDMPDDVGRVGYGLCRDDFTIEEHTLAMFIYFNDAAEYIKQRKGGDAFNNKIYFLDIPDKEGEGFERYLYDPETDKMLLPEELQGGRWKDFSVEGWQIDASREFVDEDGNWDFESEREYAVTYEEAEKIKKQLIKDGYETVEITDTFIQLNDGFWNARDFVKGTMERWQRQRTERRLDAVVASRNSFFGTGNTVYEDVSRALDGIGTGEVLKYFREQIPGGESKLRDFLEQEISGKIMEQEKAEMKEIGREQYRKDWGREM